MPDYTSLQIATYIVAADAVKRLAVVAALITPTGTSAASSPDRFSYSNAANPLTFVDAFVAAPADSQNVSDILGINTHEVFDSASLDDAKAMGVTWIRTDLFWRAAEQRPGVYNFSDWDYRFMSALNARGLKALGVLGYGNRLYTGDDNKAPNTSVQITAYINLARAAASHFAGNGVRYEIYNEPNATVPAAVFAQITNKAAAAIHAVDPEAKVTTGGLQFDFEYPNPPINYLNAVLANGGAQGVDAVGWHAYQFGDDPETVMVRKAKWDATLSKYFPNNPPPTWQTEAGYRKQDIRGSADAHALLTIRMILSQWAVGFKMIIVYDWDDDGWALKGTPTASAITKLTSVAKGRNFVSYALPSDATAWHGVRLEGATDTVGIVWLRSGQKTALVPVGTTATDMYGTALTFTPSGSQLALTVSAAKGPVYLTFPK